MQLLVSIYQVNDLAIHLCRIGSYALCYEKYSQPLICFITFQISKLFLELSNFYLRFLFSPRYIHFKIPGHCKFYFSLKIACHCSIERNFLRDVLMVEYPFLNLKQSPLRTENTSCRLFLDRIILKMVFMYFCGKMV